jgi:hypothetical protein
MTTGGVDPAMWVAMHIGLICFIPLACFVLWRSARFGLRFGPRPKPKPQMTAWHPELGRKKANAAGVLPGALRPGFPVFLRVGDARRPPLLADPAPVA